MNFLWRPLYENYVFRAFKENKDITKPQNIVEMSGLKNKVVRRFLIVNIDLKCTKVRSLNNSTSPSSTLTTIYIQDIKALLSIKNVLKLWSDGKDYRMRI